MFDAIVVGGGPGGSVAAKKCAQNGFKTMLLEKKTLPREKVCSGMVIGLWAHQIIEEEFGKIPRDVLADPFYLSGHMLHMPSTTPQIIEWRTPVTWRSNLDFWMNKRAEDQGVEILDRARVLRINQSNDECTVTIKTGEEIQMLTSKFVIGADGAASVVRKSLFPELRVRYTRPLRECYKTSLNIERDYFHWFYPKSSPRPIFDVIHKDEVFLIEGIGIRESREEINQRLAQYGFDPSTKPMWKDGCVEPLLHKSLITGSFIPARGKVLLTGDAASLLFPITYEGIGAALKSGVLAADAISKTTSKGRLVSEVYLRDLRSVIDVIKRLYNLSKELEQKAKKGNQVLSKALKHAYEETLRVV